MDEYNYCRFCKYYDDFDGCTQWSCYNNENYSPNKYKILSKAKEQNISVTDVIALIEMGE